MKVLLANYEYPGVTENCGGGGRVTELLKRGLAELGHTVTVVTDSSDGHHTTFPVRQYPHLKRSIASFRPDVVNAHFSIPTGLPLARICRKRNMPIVTSIMGADLFDPTRYQSIRPLLNQANRYVFNRSDALVTPSLDMTERVPARYQHKTETIHYGIDSDKWEWREKDLSTPIQIVTVCRLVDRKNLDTAIRAVARLRERGYNAQYTIVGKGPKRGTLLDTHAHHDWLSLPGYVEDLQATFDDSHIFFLPSKHEAFGMVFLEALASGLPVATSNTGGQTDLLPHPDDNPVGYFPGMFVGNLDKERREQYADLLENVIRHYDTLQRNTKGYVASNFSYLDMGNNYAELYDSIT